MHDVEQSVSDGHQMSTRGRSEKLNIPIKSAENIEKRCAYASMETDGSHVKCNSSQRLTEKIVFNTVDPFFISTKIPEGAKFCFSLMNVS